MYGKILLVKKMNYAELVEIYGIRPIMWKHTNYVQNYAST